MNKKFSVLKAIGNELRNIRKTQHISLKDVAEKAGVSTMYISEIERNKKAPSDEVVKKLAEIYKVDASDLFEGFKRVPEEVTEEILGFSELFDVLYGLSCNPDITIEERQKFYKEMHEKYDKLFKH